ncbi:MAG: creatininase family protein [Pseudomonadota bacterium]
MTPAAPMAPTQWSRIRSTAFDRAAAASTVVILPIGSTEQHGPHLPVEVDSLLVGEVAQRGAALATQASCPTPVLVLPTLWVSLAEHHMADAGSLTLDFETLLGFTRCIVRSLKRQGYRRILLLNGHGGNMAALTLIVDILTAELDVPVATATYWVVAASAFAEILEGQPNLLHACEAETSMVMHLRPDLVDAEAARTVTAPARGFLSVGGVHRWRPIGHWSCSGVVGTPRLASAEKGSRLLHAAAIALSERIADGGIWADESDDGEASAR